MAGIIPERQIEAVRYSTDIVDLISSYLPLKRSGSTYKACCPFHQEKTPSFHVNPTRQSYKCFGCGEYGDCFTFLMKQQGLPFIEAVKFLAERANIQLELEEDRGEGQRRHALYDINSGMASFYRRCLRQTPAAEGARRYLAERGLDGEVAEAFGIGYAPDSWDASLQWAAKHTFTADQMMEAGLVIPPPPERPGRTPYDRFRDRLMFPIQDTQGRVVGFSGRVMDPAAKTAKYVNSPETPIFHKSRVLYALDKARAHIVSAQAREAVICEGQIDVIRCHAAGIRTAVAAQGTAFTDEHVTLLKRHADGVVIVFDSDTAGQDAAVKTARLCLKAGLVPRIARLPEGQDPDSFIRTEGVEAFRECLDSAVSVVVFQLAVLGERGQDPADLAGVDRLSREVLASIAACENAILRARMLQEAAQALSVPVEALTQELAGLEARESVRLDRQERREAVRASGSGPAAAGRPTAAPSAGPAAASRAELELCEQCIRADDPQAMAALIRRYLPTELLHDAICRELVELLLRAAAEGLDAHDALGAFGAREEVRMLVETCLETRDRVQHREFSREDAVQDLIRQLWLRKLNADLVEGARTPPEARNAEQSERFSNTRSHWRELQTRDWDAAAQVIDWLMHAE